MASTGLERVGRLEVLRRADAQVAASRRSRSAAADEQRREGGGDDEGSAHRVTLPLHAVCRSMQDLNRPVRAPGPRLTWPCARKSSIELVRRWARRIGAAAASRQSAGTEPSRTSRSSPAGRAEDEHARASRCRRGTCAARPSARARCRRRPSSKRSLAGLDREAGPRARRSSRPAGGCAAAARRRCGKRNSISAKRPSLASPGHRDRRERADEPAPLALSWQPPRYACARSAIAQTSLLRAARSPSIDEVGDAPRVLRAARYHSSAARQRAICCGLVLAARRLARDAELARRLDHDDQVEVAAQRGPRDVARPPPPRRPLRRRSRPPRRAGRSSQS